MVKDGQSFNDFLEVTSGREVALAIAKDDNELKDFYQSLNELGFKETISMSDIFSNLKSFIVIAEDKGKETYDFATQYPTGQVEIFNRNHMNSKVFSPDYGNSVVLLIDEKVFNKLSAEGLDLLSVAGPAYRS